VKKGDLLAQIETVSYFAELEQAKAALGLAEANLLELENGSLPEEIADAQAAVEEARVQFLLKQKERDRMLKLKSGRNVVSEQEFDIVEAEFKRLEAQVNSLEQKLKLVQNGPRPERIAAARAKVDEARALVTKAQFFYENAAIVSPIDGTVLEKHTEVGEIVRPDVLLSDMFLLADLSRLQAEVDVQERDLHRIKVGDPCRIIPDAYPDKRYAGRIQKIRPQINRQRAVVGVEVAVLEPDEYLLPNMNCRVEFLSAVNENDTPAVRVPSSAVIQEEAESVVYILDGSTAKRCRVTANTAEGAWIEVTEGLKPGDVVLLSGESGLQDGQRVTARFATSASSAKP
jgi:multidrug efflux pump subunit AcrA (membrane-fusion protein)